MASTTDFINTSTSVLAYNAFQLLGILGGYSGEASNPMPYSKFAASSVAKKGGSKSKMMIPSRMGMLIIYVPATIVAFVFQCILPVISEDAAAAPTAVAGWMVLAHFLKRDLEVLFLHKYSGETELNAARLIGLMYALTSFMICLVAVPTPPTSEELCASIGLFVVGSLGNLYHHYLLAQLRRASSTTSHKKYVAPRGGLFEYDT
ncbi:MAG: hypothetical protein SGARI_006669 [Bacillariaceae sp.]